MKAVMTLVAALAVASFTGCARDRGAAEATGKTPTSAEKDASGTTTGTSDTRLYSPPAGLKEGDAACRDESRRYLVLSSEPRSYPDDEMRRAATCTEPELTVYIHVDTPEGTRQTEEMFVKVGEGRYLPVHVEAQN